MSDVVSTMSVRDLKYLIAEAGLGYADCIEKSELRARAEQARALIQKREEEEESEEDSEEDSDSAEGFEVDDDEIDDEADTTYGEAAEAAAASVAAQARVDRRNGHAPASYCE